MSEELKALLMAALEAANRLEVSEEVVVMTGYGFEYDLAWARRHRKALEDYIERHIIEKETS